MTLPRFIFILPVAFALLCASIPAYARAYLNDVVNLSFGSFALINNDTPQTIVVPPAGSAVFGVNVIEGPTPPVAGEYFLEDLTPNTLLDVTIADTTLSRFGGGSPLFTITDFTTNTPTTDGNGDATLFVGATLTTSGSGAHYESGNYTGTMDITIIF